VIFRVDNGSDISELRKDYLRRGIFFLSGFFLIWGFVLKNLKMALLKSEIFFLERGNFGSKKSRILG
jgi:hypothetical protein